MKILFLIILISPHVLFSQQVSDTFYNPAIQDPEYAPGEGPVVFIDEGHHNIHTKNGRYLALSTLLERDGYNVKEYKGTFEMEELARGKIIVISNALHEINVENWYVPTPSAFTVQEIEVMRQWIIDGGSLFLIADHMPMAGAAKDLAEAFGFEFTNGFALDTRSRGPTVFTIREKTLNENIITKGRNPAESVGEIASFTGQAFRIPDDATSILTFNKNFVNMLPEKEKKYGFTEYSR